MFTQRAVLLGFVAFCFYLVAVVNSLPSFYYVLVWLAVALLGASFGIALLSLAGTTCVVRSRRAFGFGNWPSETRGDEWSAPRLSEPGTNEAPPCWEVELGNSGSLNKTGLVLDLRLTDALSPESAGKRKSQLRSARFLIEALPSGANYDAPLLLGFLPRGRYTLDSTRLVGSDVLGLFRIGRRLPAPETLLEVVVGPPVVALASRREVMRGAGEREGTRERARPGVGGDLRGVRPYVAGDDWRHVHWATTARTGTLAVREFEHTGRSAVLVVWDGAQGCDWGDLTSSTVEDGLSLCASILVATDAMQTPLALALLGEQSEWRQGQSENGVLPRAMMEVLASARSQRTESLSSALFRVAQVQSGGFGHVFFVSASLRADLVEAVSGCLARGEGVSVALLDGAAWRSVRGETRRSLARGKEGATQQDGLRMVPVSVASYDEQERALRQTGARVVRVVPQPDQSRRATLELALMGLMEN